MTNVNAYQVPRESIRYWFASMLIDSRNSSVGLCTFMSSLVIGPVIVLPIRYIYWCLIDLLLLRILLAPVYLTLFGERPCFGTDRTSRGRHIGISYLHKRCSFYKIMRETGVRWSIIPVITLVSSAFLSSIVFWTTLTWVVVSDHFPACNKVCFILGVCLLEATCLLLLLFFASIVDLILPKVVFICSPVRPSRRD